ncbi:hypothetical protein D9619_012169 [Psilocybe cf. subviscida]|uniref:Glycoside hydrolase family 5 protein n=1 Tax=Psilocybe cf. subviscida TaxID=2480587 RepID=A0A8H5EZF8_9AGAR|nr:hypothetical protein D9619_012169 [Psilocybe cf. subviscida]
MNNVPSTSPATGKPLHPSYIHTTSFSFVDNAGRTLLLRGVNLSGASKAPVGHLSYLLEDFWETAEAGGESFVGRPLNIDDGSADVHLARLRGWGFNLLRFPFTWEALEHEGPGKYDVEFMDYTIRVLCKCREYGFRVYMDPHQDTWSRFSGGSGAPYWTLAACGINPRHITATQSAILHCEYPLAHQPDPASLPAMVWSTNYGRLLSQTVFTLFFAGRDFAPHCIIDGVNIQDYLQNHFIEACGQLADRIRAYDNGSLFEECIIGWDSMNEPFEGLCGWDDLNVNPVKQGSTLKKGTYPTPAQSFRLGMGQAQTVDNWVFGATGPAKNGSVTIDPKGRKIWADAAPDASTSQNAHQFAEDEGQSMELPDGTHPRWGWKRDVSQWPLGTCIWAQHGVWDVETGFVLRPDYFHFHPVTGIEVEFLSDNWKPHWIAYAKRIRKAQEEAIIFIQPPVFAVPPKFEETELMGRAAYSPHYYDGLTLITRHWNWFNADALGLLRGKYSSTLQAVKIGEGAIRKSLNEQLSYFQADVANLGNGIYPIVMGEIGTPFDMDDKRSYGWTDGGKYKGDYSSQEKALDASLNACDAWAALHKNKGKGKADGVGDSLNWTVWTYVGDDHTHEWGDGWNMEDLSLFSPHDLVGDSDDEDNMQIVDGNDKEMQRADFESRSVLQIQDEAFDSRAVLLNRNNAPKGIAARCAQIGRKQQQPRQSLPMIAARSSLTLATMGGATGSAVSLPIQHQPRSRPGSRASVASTLSLRSAAAIKYASHSAGHTQRYPYDVAGFSSNPYTLLTNGARAVRAFARPWPVKVVGKATDVRFDINKALFKLTVRVGWEDRLRSNLGHDKDGPLGTEVYLPLVHYAHGALLEDADRMFVARQARRQRMWMRKEDTEGDTHSITSMSTYADDAGRGRSRDRRTPVIPQSDGTAFTNSQPQNASPPVLSLSMTGATATGSIEADSLLTDSSPTVHDSPFMSSATPSGIIQKDSQATVQDPKPKPTKKVTLSEPPSPTVPSQDLSAPLLIRDTLPDLIDVDVRVSGGTFEIRGQTLFWWYDVPAEGELAREYTLEVHRREGVLKPPHKMRRGNAVSRQEEGEPGLCNQLCPENGPCIMM